MAVKRRVAEVNAESKFVRELQIRISGALIECQTFGLSDEKQAEILAEYFRSRADEYESLSLPNIQPVMNRKRTTDECPACRGLGHFNEDSEPSSDKRDRKCMDCRGTGLA